MKAKSLLAGLFIPIMVVFWNGCGEKQSPTKDGVQVAKESPTPPNQPVESTLSSKVDPADLIKAMEANDSYKVNQLITADPASLAHAADSHGRTALHWAAGHAYKEMVGLLLGNGADANAKDENGRTPLLLLPYDSIFHRNEGVIGLLLAAGADVNARAEDGSTPLHQALAAMGGNPKEVELLVAHGADVTARRNDGKTPFHFVGNSKTFTELFLSKGADINAKSNDGWTPLHAAVARDSYDVVGLLLTKGADVDARSNIGETPLHWAATNTHKGVAELLVAKGADVNAKGNDGRTPLHWAAANIHQEVAEFLLSNGADVNAKDNEGRTPLDIAVKDGSGLADLLRAHGAKE